MILGHLYPSFDEILEANKDVLERIKEKDREKKLRELAKVNPQEYCLALGVNDDSEIFKDISSGSLVSPMKFFKRLKGE